MGDGDVTGILREMCGGVDCPLLFFPYRWMGGWFTLNGVRWCRLPTGESAIGEVSI